MNRPETHRYLIAWIVFMVTTIAANFLVGAILGGFVDEFAAALRFALQAIVSFCTLILVVNGFILPKNGDEASSELNEEISDDQ